MYAPMILDTTPTASDVIIVNISITSFPVAFDAVIGSGGIDAIIADSV